MATPALDEAIAARFAPPFHSWYDVTHDGPPGREHTVESKASPLWSASAAPSGALAEVARAWGSPRCALVLTEALGAAAGRSLRHLCFRPRHYVERCLLDRSVSFEYHGVDEALARLEGHVSEAPVYTS